MSELKAGRELDAACGRAIGAEPDLSWNVLNADESASCYRGSSEAACETWMREVLSRLPESWVKDYHVGAWEFWPRYSTDPSDCALAKAWLLSKSSPLRIEMWRAWLPVPVIVELLDDHAEIMAVAQGSTEEEAIARLVLAVAEQPKMSETTQAVRERGGWLPIETAPTNVSVLIYLPNWEHYGPAIYRAILVDMGTGRRWHTTAWACGRDIGGSYEQPTHWMPLPDPPEGL